LIWVGIAVTTLPAAVYFDWQFMRHRKWRG
jgi:hypothetical protein